ncbi:MAG: nicotinamide-nucleotide amidohydrolase family protein, partial [Elusimicrobia bacterium]|nr:nicotinamide-nucleotide amidohydrolase family protein [Elusimicrobiota bacterium]
VPGSSRWFSGGIIAYSNAVKVRRLGVPTRLLARHGAVSAECALAMARGARAAAGARIGIAITGIAGPNGGTKAKPLGRVYVAVSGPGARGRARVHDLHGSRAAVRERAVTAALSLLLETLAS